MNEKKQEKKRRTRLYVIGSLVTAAGAFVLLPRVVDYLSEKLYTPSEPTIQSDADWGPEIVKREKKGEAEPSEKENVDGEL